MFKRTEIYNTIAAPIISQYLGCLLFLTEFHNSKMIIKINAILTILPLNISASMPVIVESPIAVTFALQWPQLEL